MKLFLESVNVIEYVIEPALALQDGDTGSEVADWIGAADSDEILLCDDASLAATPVRVQRLAELCA